MVLVLKYHIEIEFIWMLNFMLMKLCFQVFLFQKAALYKCNMAGKPAVVTRVVDSMTDNLRPTRAEATDVANAVLDGASLYLSQRTSSFSIFLFLSFCHIVAGSDAILLGAETLRGLYPIETISTVGRICAEVNMIHLL